MLKSLIRGKFIGSRSVNNPPEHFVNNQVLTVGIGPYADIGFLPFIRPRPKLSGVPSTPVTASPCHPLQAGEGFFLRHPSMESAACQPLIFLGLQWSKTKSAPGNRGASDTFLAAETSHLAQNLPDITEMKTHDLGLLVGICLSRTGGL